MDEPVLFRDLGDGWVTEVVETTFGKGRICVGLKRHYGECYEKGY